MKIVVKAINEKVQPDGHTVREFLENNAEFEAYEFDLVSKKIDKEGHELNSITIIAKEVKQGDNFLLVDPAGNIIAHLTADEYFDGKEFCNNIVAGVDPGDNDWSFETFTNIDSNKNIIKILNFYEKRSAEILIDELIIYYDNCVFTRLKIFKDGKVMTGKNKEYKLLKKHLESFNDIVNDCYMKGDRGIEVVTIIER